MKNRNKPTCSIYTDNRNNNTINKILNNNPNPNTSQYQYYNLKTPNESYQYDQVTYFEQQQKRQQNQLFNQNQERQHSNQNHYQIITPQQILPPTRIQHHHKKLNTINNHHQLIPSTNTIMTTSLTTSNSNYKQNQFTIFNYPAQHVTPYSNQSQETHQQQIFSVNRNQIVEQHEQQQMLQQQPQKNHLKPESLYQRHDQLNFPLVMQNKAIQPNQQNFMQHKRQLFEQQQVGNAVANRMGFNNNNNYVNNQTKMSNTSNGFEHEKLPMDAAEIANFLANELFMQQLVSVDGIQSGVPTLTTSTLTPTLLKSIEDSFTELIEEPVTAPFQAGFIPPTYPSTSNNTNNTICGTYNGSVRDFIETESEDSQNSLSQPLFEGYHLGGETTENSSATTDSTSFQNGLNKSSLATSNSNSASTNDFSALNVAIAATAAANQVGKKNNISSISPNGQGVTTTRRNQGGRRPAKPSNLTPEEEEKRRVRRERNKLAAARCRKRRVDLTNELLDEVSQLEKKRDILQKDIATYNKQKTDLEYILEAHRPGCQKVRQDLMTVSTFNGLIVPNNSIAASCSNDKSSSISGIDTNLSCTGGPSSPVDIKPEIINDNLLILPRIKNEPIDSVLDGSSLDNDVDGPSSPKRILITGNNPMIPPPLPKISTLSPSLAAAASLNTPIVTSAPVSFASFGSAQNNTFVVNTLNALNNKPLANGASAVKQRPTTLPTMPRNAALGLNVDNKAPTDINGVAIQTPSTGMFNFDSLMDGGTGLTPVSGPLVPTCSSQNKHPLELTTPTSEPSKLVSL